MLITSVQFEIDCLKTLGGFDYTNLLPYAVLCIRQYLLRNIIIYSTCVRNILMFSEFKVAFFLFLREKI